MPQNKENPNENCNLNKDCEEDSNELRCPAEDQQSNKCTPEELSCEKNKNPGKGSSCSHAQPQIRESCENNIRQCPSNRPPIIECLRGPPVGQNSLLSACRKYTPQPPPTSIPYLKYFNPKRYKRITYLLPSTAIYGIATLVCTIWFCDWKAVLQYLPFYNLKFKEVKDEGG